MVISRAAKADERAVALGAYQAMCDHGAAPTADTFGPLIEMLGRPVGAQQGQQRPLEEASRVGAGEGAGVACSSNEQRCSAAQG